MAFAAAKPQVIDIEVPDPPTDATSSLAFSSAGATGQDYLACASWDNSVRVYEVQATGQAKGISMFLHQAPVLSVIWSQDGSKVISAGCDNAARMHDMQTGQSTQIAQHDQPIKSVRWVNIPSAPDCHVVTGSWDKTLKYWDTRQPTPIATVNLPERLYSMDTDGKYLVAACADRRNVIYNLSDPSREFKKDRSQLKWQTRVVRSFPAGTSTPGFVTGSIEGRVGVYYIEGPSENNFSFKCHRIDKPNKPASLERPNQDIYPVNEIAFNSLGTFATCGGDGGFSFWDKDNKQRLKEVTDRGGPVVAAAFNKTSQIFAYATSYDWSQGHQGNTGQIPPKIKLHAVKEEDVQKKKGKR